ncbi:hypothetical protein [Streptomyces sp. NPDC004134]|uniref:hypothetical protein n=1 Tax=Streptomyces sp. NPDC004134 TaxID=3364691 RepID=UPI00367BED89
MIDDWKNEVADENCGECLDLDEQLRAARGKYDWSGVTDVRVLRKRHVKSAHAEAEVQT